MNNNVINMSDYRAKKERVVMSESVESFIECLLDTAAGMSDTAFALGIETIRRRLEGSLLPEEEEFFAVKVKELLQSHDDICTFVRTTIHQHLLAQK